LTLAGPQHRRFIIRRPSRRPRLLKAADAIRDRGIVWFNAGSMTDRLRDEDCRANVIHTAPDALDAGGPACPISGLETVGSAGCLVAGSMNDR